MHKRKIVKAMLTILGFVLIILCVSSLHVAQGVRVEEAVIKSASRMQPLDRPQAVPLLATAEGEMQWNRTYGGAGAEAAFAAIQTADGGFALAGWTESYGKGETDAWLVKTDATGNIEWQQTYGDTGTEATFAMIQAADGGFVLAGFTSSYGKGKWDAWLVKTNVNGEAEWAQAYGGTDRDVARAVIQTADSGFALVGRTDSYGAGGSDFWLVKTDAAGNEQWTQSYGGSNADIAYSIIQMPDKGFALVGYTTSFGTGDPDIWLVKTDARGEPQWTRTYGGSEDDWAGSGIQTADGGFALTGKTRSYGAGSTDFWLVKTDATGNMEWQQAYGGAGAEAAFVVIQAADGGFAFTGYTSSYGAGGEDFWLVKTDVTGNMEWHQAYGGADGDVARSVIQTADGGFTLAGYTRSFGAGAQDAWLVKTIPPETTLPELSVSTVTMVSPTETCSEAIFIPSFRVVGALGAILVLLGLGKRQRKRNK